MKQTVFSLLCSLMFFAFSACQKEKAVIEGQIADTSLKGKVYLGIAGQHNTQFLDKMKVIDSADIKDGKFVFALNNATEIDIYRIAFKNMPDFNIYVAAGEGKLLVKNISSQKGVPYQLEGGNEKDNKMNMLFLSFLDKFNKEMNTNTALKNIQEKAMEIEVALKLNPPTSKEEAKQRATLDSLNLIYEQKSNELYTTFSKEMYQAINDNMPSVGAILFAENLDVDRDYVFLKEFADKAAQQMPNSTPAKHFVEFMSRVNNSDLDKERKTKDEVGLNIGNLAPDFSLNTPQGKPVSLSSFRGKVLLLDFWAAWCRPCRMENPNVVAAYQKFKDKGFDILGVSLDQDKEAWLKAIEKDKLTWTQVSDLKFWDSPITTLYQVNGIPMNFLLDKDGKIIAKNLRGAELEAKLKQVLP